MGTNPRVRPDLRWSPGLIAVTGLLAAACAAGGGATPGIVAEGEIVEATAVEDSDEATETSAELDVDEIPVTETCALLTPDEAETVLGAPPLSVTPGEEADDVTGGALRYCSYVAPPLALVLSLVEADSPEEADLAVQAAVERMQEEGEAAVVAEEGLGGGSKWVVVPNAAGYIVLTGDRVFSLTLGGQGLGDPARHKENLRELAEEVAARL